MTDMEELLGLIEKKLDDMLEARVRERLKAALGLDMARPVVIATPTRTVRSQRRLTRSDRAYMRAQLLDAKPEERAALIERLGVSRSFAYSLIKAHRGTDRRPRKILSKAKKLAIVTQLKQSGLPLVQVAKQNGVLRNQLRKWANGEALDLPGGQPG